MNRHQISQVKRTGLYFECGAFDHSATSPRGAGVLRHRSERLMAQGVFACNTPAAAIAAVPSLAST